MVVILNSLQQATDLTLAKEPLIELHYQNKAALKTCGHVTLSGPTLNQAASVSVEAPKSKQLPVRHGGPRSH